MSKGQINKHSLGSITSLPEREMRQEVARWARELPIGLVGCIVALSGDTVTAPAVDWVTLPWESTDYESDNFFPAYGGGQQSKFRVPAELGGLYGWDIKAQITTASPLFVWQLVHVDAYDGTVSVIKEAYEFVTTSILFNKHFVIGRILAPEDQVYFRFGAFIGASTDFDIAHKTTFYRIHPADTQEHPGTL